jgi:hypothetical protein
VPTGRALTLPSKIRIVSLLWTLCILIFLLHHQTVAGLMVIVHLHRLMVCIPMGHHLPHLMGKCVLITSLIICVDSILHRKMIWMTTA